MKIGDVVEVINLGKVYYSYIEMAILMKTTKWRKREIRNGEIGIIKNIRFHENFPRQQLALVDFGDTEEIIGIQGLKISNIQREEIIYG